jgi:hypothetical protein
MNRAMESGVRAHTGFFSIRNRKKMIFNVPLDMDATRRLA